MLGALVSTHARLEAGQPIRVLVGEKLYDCAEIVMLPSMAEHLRKILSDDLARQIAALTNPQPPTPAAPAGALHGEPVEPQPSQERTA